MSLASGGMNLETSGERTGCESIRVLLGHPDRLLREALVGIMVHGGFNVVGQADTAQEVSALAAAVAPEVIVLDWEMEGVDQAFLERLDSYSGAYIAFVTHPENARGLMERANAGARGYLSLQLDKEEFLESLRMVFRGNVLVSGDIVPRFQESIVGAADSRLFPELSQREGEVLRLVGQGANNREIAETLIVSEHTVKAHLRSILNKLNLRNRQQMVVYAVQNDIVGSDTQRGRAMSCR